MPRFFPVAIFTLVLSILTLMASSAVTAAEGAMSAPRSDGLFQGTADASEANLTALCATALPAGLLQLSNHVAKAPTFISDCRSQHICRLSLSRPGGGNRLAV